MLLPRMGPIVGDPGPLCLRQTKKEDPFFKKNRPEHERG
jgi:hypothetical protein